jgi:hypothetical protein
MKTKRDLMLDEIFNYLMKNGELTSKQDVLDSDNKVYTKKIPVDINVDKVNIKMISVTGYEPNLSDASKNDIRVCVNNYNKDFLNLFVVSVGDDTLTKILKYFKEHE